ncbi:MAG: ribosome maturation factor RimP [Candidatus Edwardsbacteria bacterium]|nr:ribosome maturation factor RimP [Candidatus Edwardsbacteria bacterium]
MNTVPSPEEIAARVRELAQPIVGELGLDLFDVEYQPHGGLLRVFVDRPAGGVRIGDCAVVSERLSDALDRADLVPFAYRLEVSSPGLDRPLRGADDFRRFRGRMAHIIMAQPVCGRNDITGRIDELQGGMAKIVLTGKESLWLPLAGMKKARLEVEIAKGKKKK